MPQQNVVQVHFAWTWLHNCDLFQRNVIRVCIEHVLSFKLQPRCRCSFRKESCTIQLHLVQMKQNIKTWKPYRLRINVTSFLRKAHQLVSDTWRHIHTNSFQAFQKKKIQYSCHKQKSGQLRLVYQDTYDKMQISTAADGTALSLKSGYSLNKKCAIHISQRNDCAQQGDVKQ